MAHYLLSHLICKVGKKKIYFIELDAQCFLTNAILRALFYY